MDAAIIESYMRIPLTKLCGRGPKKGRFRVGIRVFPTSFHHRRPTRSRPVTFFTVQKSNDNSSTITTKLRTKLLLKKLQNR